MGGILDVKEPRRAGYVPEAAIPRARRRRPLRPFDGGLRADMALAPGRGKTREGFEIFRCPFQLEAERLAQREIAFDVGDQHAGLPAQGWAISERSAKSTLA